MDQRTPASKTKGIIWLLTALLAGGAAALGLPFVARHVPWPMEQRLASMMNGSPELKACDLDRHLEAAALLEKVIRRVYPLYPSDREFPVSVTLIRGDSVNAFAFLGGRIYVYEGLLKQAESAEELAGILAHEIEHVKRRHIMQGVFVRLLTVQAAKAVLTGHGSMDPRLAGMLLNMRFSREQEGEADEGGLKRLHDARIDVSGFQRFFERAENQSSLPTILSDHPANEARAGLIKKYRTGPSVPIMSRAEWALVKKICE
jgi:Zn-dependent protease with chaperone function